jgi:hypothetical protein
MLLKNFCRHKRRASPLRHLLPIAIEDGERFETLTEGSSRGEPCQRGYQKSDGRNLHGDEA